MRKRIYEVTVGLGTVVDDRFFVAAMDFAQAHKLAQENKDRYEFTHDVDVVSITYRGELAARK